ncbi:MAG: TonB-dependent receptor [Pyrinomonadaceae bacterium]|nr:TonB-dependent receptor [Pyrinomonadaceae bacterium]
MRHGSVTPASGWSQQGGAFKWSDIGVPAAEQGNDLPNINIVGSFQIGGAFPETFNQRAFNFDDTLSYIVGRHSLQVGGSIIRSAVDVSDFRFNGALIFLSFPDFLLGLNGPSNGTGLFSNVFGSIDFIGLPDRKHRVFDGHLFAQDDFKVSTRLTLNLGLRYERIGHFADQLGRNANFDPALANSNPPATGSIAGYVVPNNFAGQIPAGVGQLDNELGIKGEGQNNLAPRLGAAWQILPRSSRLVLRGGYGIYYSRPTGQPFFQLEATPPFGMLRVSTGAANASATFQNPFPQPIPSASSLPTFAPYSPATGLSVRAIAQDYRPSRTQQYSLNLQAELAPNLLLEVGYVGTRGDHLIRTRSINQAQLASASNPIRGITTNTLANVPQRVPIQGFQANALSVIESAGMARYNGLEISLTKRFSQGLQFLTSYTFSKSLDTDGAATQATSGGGNTTGNQNDPKSRYGINNFDRTHRLVLSYVYELPGLKRLTGFPGKLLSGWSVSGVTVFQSGQALTITGTNANNVFGVTADRAQLAPGCTYSQIVNSGSVTQNLNNYVNRSCFTAWPVIGADGRATDFGNSGVGIVRGPKQNNFDVALVKRTGIGWLREGANFEFRTEFFNAFNTPQFANPDTNFSSATFGQITSTSVNPRIIQFALKLNF